MERIIYAQRLMHGQQEPLIVIHIEGAEPVVTVLIDVNDHEGSKIKVLHEGIQTMKTELISK